MSTIFYDHLITVSKIEEIIASSAESNAEKEELWQMVDDMIHHQVLLVILDALPTNCHAEFLQRFYDCPYDTQLITYLNERIENTCEVLITREIDRLIESLTNDINNS